MGRGLGLPVDELGYRLSEEQFYLKYLIDFTEKDFAKKLVGEINSEVNLPCNIKDRLGEVARLRKIKEEELFIELLRKGYVDTDKNIKEGWYEKLIQEYPEFNQGVYPDKILESRQNKKTRVKIRPDKFKEIEDLWNSINQKYYLKLDKVSEELLKVSKVPEKFLYDSFVYDSIKEKETISRSVIDEIVVFGKIPRNSIRVPLYFGGTTSPDFMYVLKKTNGQYIINFIVETKGVDEEGLKRKKENLKIQSARVFFETLKEDGLNVHFEEQLNDDDIVNMIRKLV